MTNLSNELAMDKLDEVSGGLGPEIVAAVLEIIDFALSHHGLTDSINFIKQQAGK